jgi:hypothetical protein
MTLCIWSSATKIYVVVLGKIFVVKATELKTQCLHIVVVCFMRLY